MLVNGENEANTCDGSEEPILAWRFLAPDCKLGREFAKDMRVGGHPTPPLSPVSVGDTLRASNWGAASLKGLHGYFTCGDALIHGRGHIACRVLLRGATRHVRRGRIEAIELCVRWLYDATRVIAAYPVTVAEQACETLRNAGSMVDPRLDYAVAVRREWLLGAASDAEWGAARDAAEVVQHEARMAAQASYGEYTRAWHEWQVARRDWGSYTDAEREQRLSAVQTTELGLVAPGAVHNTAFLVTHMAPATRGEMRYFLRYLARDVAGEELGRQITAGKDA